MPNSQLQSVTLDQIAGLAKRRGFVFPTSNIYGGLTSSYDYGPLGAELMRNIRNAWWDFFISKRPDMVGLDSQIMLHPQTWVASGHVSSFSDPLVEDTVTQKRYRADHLIEQWLEKHPTDTPIIVENMTIDAMAQFLAEKKILSPDGNPVTAPKSFNLLFETAIGSVAGDKAKVYLRGETAQGIFTNFKNILDSTRVQLPFGVGQIGKSFRNEITTGQFVFRTLEFEQAEIEYFFNPAQTDWQLLFQEWQDLMWQFVTEVIGIDAEHLRWRTHADTERSFYSLETKDLEYKFPFGWKELWGIAYRTDYDLKQHENLSGENLHYTDPHTGENFIPHVIEPALGLSRAFLMLLCDRYWSDTERNRTVLRLPQSLAPTRAAVFPLVRNKPELVAAARSIWQDLAKTYRVSWDDRGNIGKRYLYQDEVGTPFCITVDYQTLEDQTVTVRDRDTARQVRVEVAKLSDYIS